MVCLKKKTVLMIVILLIVSGVLLIEPCMASVTIPANPKAGPEITFVTIHNTPIWNPPVITTNPYTGEVTNNKPGYWIQNGTIEITIKNKSFTPYTDENGNTINTYYCIFYKFSDSTFGWLGYSPGGGISVPIAVYQSDSIYTIKTFTYGESSQLGYVKVDISFRIQTVEDGYFGRDPVYGSQIFEGVGSKWTEFTVTMPSYDPYKDNNPSGTFKPNIKPTSVAPDSSDPNNLPTSNPDNPHSQTPWTTYLLIVIATVCIITVPLVIVMYYNKRQQHKRKVKYSSNSSSNFQFTEVCEVKSYG
jgi:hypothetical protein